MSYSQFAATSQFYLYGRQYCTQTGYISTMKEMFKNGKVPDPMNAISSTHMTGKVCLVTGANSGVGKEVAQFLASKGATVVMLCRDAGRAEAARDEIVASSNNKNVSILLCDLSLETDVRRAWAEFSSLHQSLHVLVCNAGVLLNDKYDMALCAFENANAMT